MPSRTWLPLAGVACALLMISPGEAAPAADEREVVLLPLSGPVSAAEAELSGLTWRDDELVLLPQFPERFGTGSIFTVRRTALVAAIEDGARLDTRAVPFDDRGLAESIGGFEGFEAIAFVGDDVYLTIEAGSAHGTRGYVVRGHASVDGILTAVTLDAASAVELEAQTDIDNVGYEALVATEDEIVVLYEVNGASNPHPVAQRFDRDLRPLGPIAMTPLEYRVTDASAVDTGGHFWVSNYFYEGDTWPTATCPLSARFGIGASSQGELTVERLVEMSLDGERVQPTDDPPILLELAGHGVARNWEGIARLGDRGFLLVTDEHPCTMLAFVPTP